MGGADTKLVHLLKLLHRDVWFTVIPNDEERLKEREWVKYLDRLGIHATLLERLPHDLTGCALSLANTRFFCDRIAHRAKERGLKIIWSSEMMWHHPNELDAVREGVIDTVLYVSEFQRSVLQPGYGTLPGRMTGNYIDPDDFPFRERRNPTFTIGRLSRPDPAKYPENFPVFYESLGLEDTAFRVMAWSNALARRYRWHDFDARWDLLAPAEVPTLDFLHSLDLFVYPLGHSFQESWGRSVVEAMLTGAVPLVPRGHHFEQLLIDGETGFFCDDFAEWREHAQHLRKDPAFRHRIAHQAHEHARMKLCNAEEHRRVWLETFRAVLANGANGE
jgi:glycosyltransferase involved in cell wall biosynthesis